MDRFNGFTVVDKLTGIFFVKLVTSSLSSVVCIITIHFDRLMSDMEFQ